MTTIVLADDHPVVRQGLKAVLESQHDLRVVGEAADGLDAVSAVERLRPDVLVVDLMMPGLNGVEVARRTSRSSPGTRVIVLSIYSDVAYVAEALFAGAAGYVIKEASPDHIVRAIQTGARESPYLSPPLSADAVEAYVRRSRSDSRARSYDTLTLREREVLTLIAQGHTSKAISFRLSISPRTAEVHRANLMRKLGLRSQADVIKYAIQNGILPVSESPRLNNPTRSDGTPQG